MTIVSLVRHGFVHNPRQVYYGRLPGFTLAELGRAQAAVAGRLLAREGVVAIYHSPMQRAAETAALIQAELPAAVPIMESGLLNEILSSYDGRPAEEMARRHWDFYSDVAPPFETPEAILARVREFFELVLADHTGQHVVGVSHGDPIAFAILWASGLLVTGEARQRLEVCGVPEGYPSPACVASFYFADNGAGELIGFRYRWPGEELMGR